MADEIRFDDTDARRRIDRLALFLVDLRPFWPRLVPLATSWWRQMFLSEGAYDGSPWAALSPSYADWKQRHFPGKPILELTGDMRRAASDPLRFASPSALTLTIEDDKVGRHQQGTATMPARPLVFGDPLPGAAQEQLQQSTDGYVRDLLGRI